MSQCAEAKLATMVDHIVPIKQGGSKRETAGSITVLPTLEAALQAHYAMPVTDALASFRTGHDAKSTKQRA